jgi:twinfilin-like protein
LDSTSTATASELSTTISNSEPRYSFYKYTHTYNSETSSPIVFIYTCPTASKIRERMLYAASRGFAQRLGENEAGLKVEKNLEASGPDEIGEKELYDEFHPKMEVKKTFERPRRPGRK